MSDSQTTSILRGTFGLPDYVWPCVYALLALVACWLVGPLDVPLIADNQHYFFISERFASGTPPHLSHFDPKNALSMMLTGGAIMIGRAFGMLDIYSARLLSVLVTAGCYALLWIVARRYARSGLTAHVAALAAFTYNQFIIMGTVGARPKVFLVFFILCAFLAIQARRPLLSGLATAAAFLCWQPALLFVGLAPLALILWDRPIRSMLWFAAGFVALTGLYEAYFVYHGAFWEQIEQAYRFPSQYMSGLEFRWGAIRMRFGWITKTSEGISLRSVVPSLGLAFVAGSMLWLVVRPFRALLFLRERPEWAYMIGTGLVALAYLHLDYQGFPDRFIIEPLLAIGFAMLVCLPLQWLRSSDRAIGPALIPLIGGVSLVVATIPRLDFEDFRGAVLPSQLRVGQRVAELLAEDKTIWAIGCTHFLAFAKHGNWVPYGFFFRGMDRYMGERFGRPYIPFVEGELPDVVLLSRGKLEGIATWLPRFYERVPGEKIFDSAVVFWKKREEPLDHVAGATYRSLRVPTRKVGRQQPAQTAQPAQPAQ